MHSRRLPLRIAVVSAAVLCVPFVATAQEATPRPTVEQARKIGWPMLTGPTGNFQALQSGIDLVDRAEDIRLVWASEYSDIGFGKAGRRPMGVVRSLKDPVPHQGGFSSPIVADGTVYVSHFRPGGDVRFDSESFRLEGLDPTVLTVAADDVVVAIEAATGKTRWVAAQEGKGLSLLMGKRGGWGPTPVYHDGRVFAVGTTGRIYALSAADGTLLWESNVGPRHEQMEKLKTEALKARSAPGNFGSWDSSPILAGGMLVVPDYSGGLRGHDVKTGKLQWQRPKVLADTATPAIVSLDGRQLLLCPGGMDGQVHLVDPKDGSLLWTLKGLGPNRRTLTPIGDVVLLGAKPVDGKESGRFAGYQIGLNGARKLWDLPEGPQFGDQWRPDSGAHRYTAGRDGTLFLFVGRDKEAGTPNALCRIRLSDGQVLLRRELERITMPYICEDMLVFFGDLNHHPDWGTWQLLPMTFTKDTPVSTAGFKHRLTSGYEVQMEFPYVAGHIYMRTIDGRVVCYDLRRQP